MTYRAKQTWPFWLTNLSFFAYMGYELLTGEFSLFFTSVVFIIPSWFFAILFRYQITDTAIIAKSMGEKTVIHKNTITSVERVENNFFRQLIGQGKASYHIKYNTYDEAFIPVPAVDAEFEEKFRVNLTV